MTGGEAVETCTLQESGTMCKTEKSEMGAQRGDTHTGGDQGAQEGGPHRKEHLVCGCPMASSHIETHVFIFS